VDYTFLKVVENVCSTLARLSTFFYDLEAKMTDVFNWKENATLDIEIKMRSNPCKVLEQANFPVTS
jgi:hypothetical protein